MKHIGFYGERVCDLEKLKKRNFRPTVPTSVFIKKPPAKTLKTTTGDEGMLRYLKAKELNGALEVGGNRAVSDGRSFFWFCEEWCGLFVDFYFVFGWTIGFCWVFLAKDLSETSEQPEDLRGKMALVLGVDAKKAKGIYVRVIDPRLECGDEF